jgi:hypothetical protein
VAEPGWCERRGGSTPQLRLGLGEGARGFLTTDIEEVGGVGRTSGGAVRWRGIASIVGGRRAVDGAGGRVERGRRRGRAGRTLGVRTKPRFRVAWWWR